ncbi:family 2 encapsulin nanocompartment cargo protein terpene cyclase [Actinoplanes oblitus]|uniref:Terpene synthase n=1 Tax=Actinoplanes oblitus TaxID=3040509 RepID=A0ABY8WKI9_9ACTN|nr:family 2 encapsulin nanocompartment cargo protein terpene cyclase [Actinoplanes oblitus]WIM98389.1 family 2 encapsulin nanocompartment cargo protein terpene cyclase [Actinoplanes oblitus]
MPLASDLGRAILRDRGGAPSGDLGAVLGGVPKMIGLGPSGLGTSAARAFLPSASRPSLSSSTPGPSSVRPPLSASRPSPSGPSAATVPPPGTDGPRLNCPGPLRDDPALGEWVNEAVVRWAGEVGIYPGRLDTLRSANFGRFMMLAHPATSDPDRLLAATKCLVAEWAADDYYVDEVSLGADPMVLGSRLANLLAVVDPVSMVPRYRAGYEAYHRLQPISVAFRSAMAHLAEYASVAQLGRFQHQMAILFLAWTQEADWHANRRTPPVWEYLVQRHLNSYLPPMILIDVLAGYELPADEFHHPDVRRAFTTAGNAAVLINDLYSGKNESENDHNLPSVLMADEGLGHRAAVLRTVEIHNELMDDFVRLAGALSVAGSPQLRRFLADTWAWLGGSREWHATSGRYHSSD